MKKIYLAIFAIASISGVAQNGRVASKVASAQPINAPVNKVIDHQSTQAAGDTVWVFDGLYSYDWNMTLPGTYSVGIEDIDGLTHNSAVTTYYGATGSFKIFYEQDPAATSLHYGHTDTVFYASACSWFATPGQANNWIEFGPIHVPSAGGTLSWLHTFWDANYRDGYEVLVNTTGLASTNFTNAPIFSVADNDASTTGEASTTSPNAYYPRTVSIPAGYAGQDIYIAFRHTGNDMFVLNLTNIMMTEAAGSGVKDNNTFTIGNCMPNPAVGSTTITYVLKENSAVNFTVTDMQGNVVYTQNLGNQSVGGHHVNLNTSSLASGMYMYTFDINGAKAARKFVVNN